MKLYNCPYKGDMCFLYGNCEECAFYKSMKKNRNYRKTIKNLKKDNAELQKQVGELKEYADTTYKKAVEREEDAYSLGFDKGVEQAVKDTAKEILRYILSLEEHGLTEDYIVEWTKNRIIERYGVVVE